MNRIEASPQKTWAVVVGIDRYGAGPHWNLDGPVCDSCNRPMNDELLKALLRELRNETPE